MPLGPLSSKSRVIWALRVGGEERKQGREDEGGKEEEMVSEGKRNILFWEVKRDRKGPTL